jgi:hypothetical protein
MLRGKHAETYRVDIGWLRLMAENEKYKQS